jgi:hypothetical protein
VAKMTKALYPKRPALIPMPGSMLQTYLREDDLGAQAPFAERALGLVRGYQRDLDRNRAAVRAVRQELARCGYGLTEVRMDPGPADLVRPGRRPDRLAPYALAQ